MAAGWALDLFRGRQTREHGDIEIAIPAASFPEVRNRFPGYVFDGAGSGRLWADATPDVNLRAPRLAAGNCTTFHSNGNGPASRIAVTVASSPEIRTRATDIPLFLRTS